MRLRVIGRLAAATVILAMGGLGAQALLGGAAWAEAPVAASEKPASAAELRERWGISMKEARLTAQGHLIRVVYHVYDVEKAAPLLDRANKAFLNQGELSIPVPVPPKIGALRQNSRNPKPDRDYFILFSNPSGRLKPGDRVSLTIGDFFRADDLVIKGIMR